MTASLEQGVHLTIDSGVTLVFLDGARPNVAFGTVVSEAPLCLRTSDPVVRGFTFPREVHLVLQESDRLLRGRATVERADSGGDETVLYAGRVEWENLDRRRFARVAVELPVALRAVHDVHGDTTISVFQGYTQDLSEGGAWIRVSPTIEVGSLVEFQARLDGNEIVRAFGLVAHADGVRGGIGITFLDYVGGARTQLTDFLMRAA